MHVESNSVDGQTTYNLPSISGLDPGEEIVLLDGPTTQNTTSCSMPSSEIDMQMNSNHLPGAQSRTEPQDRPGKNPNMADALDMESKQTNSKEFQNRQDRIESESALIEPNITVSDKDAEDTRSSPDDSPEVTPVATARSLRSPSASMNVSPSAKRSLRATSSSKLTTNPELSTTPRRSRFSFLTSPITALKSFTNTATTSALDDELLYLDIEAALSLKGAPTEGAAFSPSAFKNLQLVASGLLHKFQKAYEEQALVNRDILTENKSVGEDIVELQIRNKHLKQQLEEMARKAAETEAGMELLVSELSKEKRSLAGRLPRDNRSLTLEISTIPEGLTTDCVPQKSMWRRSSETVKSGFSTDVDGESNDGLSVFSRSRSPVAPSISDMSSIEPSPSRPPTTITDSHLLPPKQTSPITAFQRLFKGMSGDALKIADTPIVEECANCQGQSASVAWDTASLLRDENKGLKSRVTELESALEGALDIVNSVGL